MRGCVAIPFMVREPRTGLFDRNSSPYPFALSLSKGSEAIATQYLKTGEDSRSIFSLFQGRYFSRHPLVCKKALLLSAVVDQNARTSRLDHHPLTPRSLS